MEPTIINLLNEFIITVSKLLKEFAFNKKLKENGNHNIERFSE